MPEGGCCKALTWLYACGRGGGTYSPSCKINQISLDVCSGYGIMEAYTFWRECLMTNQNLSKLDIKHLQDALSFMKHHEALIDGTEEVLFGSDVYTLNKALKEVLEGRHMKGEATPNEHQAVCLKIVSNVIWELNGIFGWDIDITSDADKVCATLKYLGGK
jgi:hypothetical protein